MSKCEKTREELRILVLNEPDRANWVSNCLAELDEMETELTKAYDKGYVDGTDYQNESNHKNIIEPLQAENKRLEQCYRGLFYQHHNRKYDSEMVCQDGGLMTIQCENMRKLETENTDLMTRIQDGADLISGYQKDLDNARAENKRYRKALEHIRRYKCEICNGDDDPIKCCPNACSPYIAIKALKETEK